MQLWKLWQFIPVERQMSHNRSNKDDKDEICKVQSEDLKKKTNIQNRNTIQNICVLIIIDNLPTT